MVWPLDAFGGLLSQTWCYVHLAWPDVMHIWSRLELHNCTFCVFVGEEYYGAPAGGMHLSGSWSGCPDIFKSWLLLLLLLLHHSKSTTSPPLKIIVQHHAPCADFYPCLKYNFIMLAIMELAWQHWWSDGLFYLMGLMAPMILMALVGQVGPRKESMQITIGLVHQPH